MGFFELKKCINAPLLFLSGVCATSVSANVFVYDKDNFKAYIGGFAELDMMSDSTQSLLEMMGSNPIDRKGTLRGDNGRVQFSARNSRFAVGVLTNRGDSTIKGHIEFDLLGFEPNANPVAAGAPTVSEASFFQNPTMRLRHAYFQATENGWSILAGQYWSLFGWQSDYVPSSVSVAPITGVLFERSPQLTGAKTFGEANSAQTTLAVSLSRPVQREADIPNIDLGLKFALGGYLAPYAPSNGDIKLGGASVGLSATFRQLAQTAAGSKGTTLTRKKVSAFAVDAMLPLIGVHKGEAVGNTLVLIGEYSTGQGYGDQFPGWTGGILNPTGVAASANTPQQPSIDQGVEGFSLADDSLVPVKLQSWNSSLQYHLPQGWDGWVTSGFGNLLSRNAKDLKTVGNIYDRSQSAFFNVVHNFNQEIRAGVEYSWTQTRYLNQVYAQNNRVQISTWYRF